MSTVPHKSKRDYDFMFDDFAWAMIRDYSREWILLF